MSRTYTAKLIALTLGASVKWVDNLLSHHDVPGVTRGKQGVERRIADEGLFAIAAIRILTEELGLGLSQAALIVRSALASRTPEQMRYTTESGIVLQFPVAEIDRRMRERLLDAVEAVARVSRGRPRRDAKPRDPRR